MTATSKHYTALYNVITNLLMYQDPAHRHRADRVDSFVLVFDRKDRDPNRLLTDLFNLQQSIRSLRTLHRGYEANVDLLTEEGKGELFKIRTDLLDATEQLFTVFEAISVSQSRDDARAALKSAARMDVRIGGIAWHMLKDDLKPLVKLDIEGTLYSHLSNKDGSTDSALAIGDLSALNSDADAIFPEIMVRQETSGYGRKKVVSAYELFLLKSAERIVCVCLLVYLGTCWRHPNCATLRLLPPSCTVQVGRASRTRSLRLHLQ